MCLKCEPYTARVTTCTRLSLRLLTSCEHPYESAKCDTRSKEWRECGCCVTGGEVLLETSRGAQTVQWQLRSSVVNIHCVAQAIYVAFVLHVLDFLRSPGERVAAPSSSVASCQRAVPPSASCERARRPFGPCPAKRVPVFRWLLWLACATSTSWRARLGCVEL